MKIGIIGSGVVGQSLAEGFAKKGHSVMLGTRDPNKPELRDWLATMSGGIELSTFAQAAAFGEALAVATLWANGATQNALALAGHENFAGKLVMDATNPLQFADNRPGLEITGTDSAGESIQRWLPDAHVVKAFNNVNARVMIVPIREEGEPDMFIAGNDADAKATATKLLQAFGWNVIDLGDIVNARWIEALTMIWVVYAKNNNWTSTHAFKLLKK